MRRHSHLWITCAALFAAVWVLTVPAPGRPASPRAACIVARRPNSLWSLAQCCAKDLHSNRGCRYYSKADDFIILKDNSPAKPDAYLIIPTTKVTGIEDPHIFATPVDDFWVFAWQQAQIYVKKRAAETGLAINSEFGRTQNQLHIHISCVRRDVAQTLAANQQKFGDNPATPAAIALGLQNNVYRVIKVQSLVRRSPFDLVAAMPGAGSDMAAQSIAVIGAKTPGLYYVLDTYHHGADPGAAEELLDQSCQGS
jgi:CDP-diacylglycerol pyrophosphatase